MGKKKKASPAAAAAPAGLQLAACDHLGESPLKYIKTLNSPLEKEAAEHRVQKKKLSCEINGMEADRVIAECIQKNVIGVVMASEMIGNPAKKDESSSTEREVSEAECGEPEENMVGLMQSSNNETVLLESILEKKEDLAEKSMREMDESVSKKESAETRANASKELNELLESEVCGLKSSLEDQNKKNSALVERNWSDYCMLKKEKLGLEKTLAIKEEEMDLQNREFKGNMTKMEEEKKLLEQIITSYKIQINCLHGEISKLQSVLKRFKDDNVFLSDKCSIMEAEYTALQTELKLKTTEAAGLKSQHEEIIKNKHELLRMYKELQLKLSELTSENGNMKISLNEKASLEKTLEASQKGLHDSNKKLIELEKAYFSILAMLTNATSEEQNENDDIEIHSFSDYLDTIKQAIISKDGIIQEMSHELELMKFQKNKGGNWRWLLPSTAVIIGAITLAYAARAR